MSADGLTTAQRRLLRQAKRLSSAIDAKGVRGAVAKELWDLNHAIWAVDDEVSEARKAKAPPKRRGSKGTRR